MRRWILCLLIVVLTVAACEPLTSSNSGQPATVDPRIFSWDRSPNAVIFSAETVGGQSDFRALSDIPLCALYGDNRLVWLNELGGFDFEVLYDGVGDSAIREFISYLTVTEAIYTHAWNFDNLFATAEVAPVVETVRLIVNGVEHRADSLSGWDAQWFTRVVTMCQRLASAPILFQPAGAWITAQPTPYSVQAPISVWDSTRMGFRLTDAAQARWVTGVPLLDLWNALRSLPGSLLYTEDQVTYYQIAVQVPGISVTSPPAP
ncbi:MAG: hypothetical protein IAE80_23495 [Anaerolinea sp.]|nr:hypothetical protein [Anaerolinea sp.]